MNTIKKIKIIARYLVATNKFLVSFFGNTLGIPLNMRWKKYHTKCKFAYSVNSQNEIANHIKNTGLGAIGNFECSKLSQQVSIEFNKMGSTRLPSKQLPRENCGQFSKEIFSLLTQASPIIESYYQSYFQPYWISIQENFPGIVSAESSFGWHIDDNPRELMKIFIYLNDVTEKNGAFRAFPLDHSRKILRQGFVSNSEKVRLKNQSLVVNYLEKNPKSLKVLEGKAGTLLMFDNNLVHKGTPPFEGYRQLVQIEVYPSVRKISEKQICNALTLPISFDYPRNPYFNDIAGH